MTIDSAPTDSPSTDGPDTDDEDDDVIVLPWYRNPVNIIVSLLAVLILAGTAGFVIGERNAVPDPNATDIGFLQDMRAHHEQAVQMAFAFLAKPGANPNLQTVAYEIVQGQQLEIGRMIQLLRDYGKSEANESGIGMAWMQQPVPLDRMPGLASEADLDALESARGTDADSLFSRLMIAHHEGGITMAEYAASHAGTSEVVDFAKGIVTGQQSEIGELQRLGG
ncbi:MAG: DUF305 domain-containing protein [Ilumatobacteraceae bacterium]